MEKATVVIGIGNVLMGDEGVGCKIIERFLSQSESYPAVEFVDAGTGGMSLLHIISGREKAVITDCAAMGTEPGTIKRFTPDDVQSVKQLRHFSLHETDVLQVIEMCRRLGDSPTTIVLFGIEPERVEPGRQLSQSLFSKLDEYVSTIANELCR